MNWKKLDTFVCIQSPWLTLIGEKWQDEQQKILDYWRVEKADSVIVIPIYRDQFLLPQPMFRPGVEDVTLDFPGGRLPNNQTPSSVVATILKRELDIPESAILSREEINHTPWIVNSSFSNQKLYGFIAHLDSKWEFPLDKTREIYAVTPEGINNLLEKLTCLQCRSLLLQWLVLRMQN
ncbi:MAG: NUDIX hydrolase [Microcystaceae cyanobacterium]